MKKENWLVIITGVLVGVAALVLTKLGNPANMGFCIACFERDIAGAVGLHSAAKVQYVRPEIIGLVLGAFIMALAGKEFRPQAGSSPATRFVLGAFVMIGALVFLGCPLRMVLRMGGGDLNALVGLAGFVIGIVIGILFLKRGFSLKRSYPAKLVEGTTLPAAGAGAGSPRHLPRQRGRPRLHARPRHRRPAHRFGGGRSGPEVPPVHGGRHP